MARAIWTRRCSGRRLVSPRSRLAFDSHDLARSTVRRISTVARGDIAGVAAGGPGLSPCRACRPQWLHASPRPHERCQCQLAYGHLTGMSIGRRLPRCLTQDVMLERVRPEAQAAAESRACRSSGASYEFAHRSILR